MAQASWLYNAIKTAGPKPVSLPAVKQAQNTWTVNPGPDMRTAGVGVGGWFQAQPKQIAPKGQIDPSTAMGGGTGTGPTQDVTDAQGNTWYVDTDAQGNTWMVNRATGEKQPFGNSKPLTPHYLRTEWVTDPRTGRPAGSREVYGYIDPTTGQEVITNQGGVTKTADLFGYQAPEGAAPVDEYGRAGTWNQQTGRYDYPPGWGTVPGNKLSAYESATLGAGAKAQEQQAAWQQQQFGLQKQQMADTQRARWEGMIQDWYTRQQELRKSPRSWIELWQMEHGQQPGIETVPGISPTPKPTLSQRPAPEWIPKTQEEADWVAMGSQPLRKPESVRAWERSMAGWPEEPAYLTPGAIGSPGSTYRYRPGMASLGHPEGSEIPWWLLGNLPGASWGGQPDVNQQEWNALGTNRQAGLQGYLDYITPGTDAYEALSQYWPSWQGRYASWRPAMQR